MQTTLKMGNTEYRVKLYGHTAEDRDKFCRDLAVLLGVELQIARALLDDVPVVIGRTATREQAEHLRERLGLIRGLCLVEAEEAEAASVVVEAGQRGEIGLEQEAEARRERDSFLSDVWLTVLIGITGLMVLVGSVLFVSHWVSMYKENRAATVAPQEKESPREERTQPETPDPKEYEEQIRQQVEALEARLAQLQFQVEWQEEELRTWTYRRPVNHEEIRRAKVNLALTHEEINAVGKELKRLRSKLSEL